MKSAVITTVFGVALVCLVGIPGTARADINTGLAAHWTLDEESGTIAHDRIGGYDGTLMGDPQWTTGKVFGGVQLDGTDDYVELPIGSLIASLTNSSFATWVNFTDTGLYWQRVFDFGSNTTYNMFLTPRSDANAMRFAITLGGGGAAEQRANATAVLPTGWHHVAVTFDADSDTITLYLDGAVAGQNTAAALTPSDLGNTTQNWLGRSQYADPYFAGSLDDFRVYDRVLSLEDVVELMNWVGGANAGPDQTVTTGDTVTLTGQGPAGSTFSWEQIGGQSQFEAVLEPSADQAEVSFDTPSQDVGFLLTFELTVTHPTEGVNTDTVRIYVYAPNVPKLAPGNLREQPTDKGLRLVWDPVFDASDYTILLETIPGTWFPLSTAPDTTYEFKGLQLGTPVRVKVRADNSYGAGAETAAITYMPMRNLAITQANGGTWPPSASFNYDGDEVPGLNNRAYDDNNNSQGTAAETEDFWGYLWPQPLYFDRIAYISGTLAYDGGWWTGLTVQYTEDGTTWVTVPNVQVTPAYDFTDAPAGRANFARYDITFMAVRGTGLRLYGTPGGMDSFTSIAELEVYGSQLQGPLVVQGMDAVFPERASVTLDGSHSFSERGAISGYTWVQLSGPTVTIEDANAAVASFDAPAVDEDTLYVFQLTATDGTDTKSDADVRIVVKNLKTTAIAGPDQTVAEEILVTLNGSGSLTTSGNITYAWSQVAGSPVTLTDADQAVCTFTSPAIWDFVEQLQFRLQVTDGVGGSSTDEANVNVTNPVFDVQPLGPGYWRDLLHLGQTPADRFTAPLDTDLTTNDYLANWGGQANVNPVAGEAYDFTGTGVTTTVNPMVWTPEHHDNGFFAWDARASGAFDAFGQIYHIYILSPEPKEARVRYRHDDEMRLFNNGALARGSDGWDNGTEAWGNIALDQGVNSMLLRVEEGDGGNHIAARITDRNDVPYSDLFYALSIPNPLQNAYAVRDLPNSYEPGTIVDVSLSVRANPDSALSSIQLRETVPSGLTVADAGGGEIIGDAIYWNLTGEAVGIHSISYSLNVPGGTTGALDFAGTVNYSGGTPDQGVSGDSVVYEVPSAPTRLDVEILLAAHLSWIASPDEGISGYRIYRDVDGTGWQEIAFVTGTSYVDDWIESGRWYRYNVAAVNVGEIEGPASSPSEQKTRLMEIREAEDFNYGGGLYPWETGVTVAAVEATAQDDLDAGNDFWHPNKGGPRDYRPLDAVGIWTATEVTPATGRVNMGVGWIYPGSWWRYSFDVPEPGPDDPPGGWVKLVLRIATLPNQPSSVTAYWDETPVGTGFLDAGPAQSFHHFAMDEFQTTPGTHTLRVEAGGETAALDVFDFEKIGIGFNWTPPKRKTLWQDDFESYASNDDVFSPTAGGWTRGNTTNTDGSWMLWDTGQEPLDIGGVEGQYMISNSDRSGAGVLLDEELLTPEVDCAGWTKLRLNFDKSYRIYDDPDHSQDAEVDIRSFDPTSGWSGWTNLLHLDTASVPATLDPPELNTPEVFDLSAYDGKTIQIRFHFFNAEYDYWFAVDNVLLSGEQLAQEIPLPDVTLDPGTGLLTISWGAFGSGQYTVETTNDLVNQEWAPVPGEIWPTSLTSWSQPLPATGKAYYRVMGSE